MPFIKGKKPWNYGIKIDKKKYPNIGNQKPHSKEAKEKISKANKGCEPNAGSFKKGQNVGANNCNYVDGTSSVYKLIRRMPEYKQWRSNCFERDNWTCQTCNIRGVYLTVHHIKSFARIVRDNDLNTTQDGRECDELWDEENGVTLCEDCHKLTDNYGGKNKLD